MNNSLLITNIQIESLFGLYNHQIALNKNERVTIIHGPNGIGKTALLRLVNALVTGNYSYLCEIPFSLLKLTLNDGSILGVRKDLLQESDSKIIVFKEVIKNHRPKIQSHAFAISNWQKSTKTHLNKQIASGSNKPITKIDSALFIRRLSSPHESNPEPSWLTETRNQLKLYLIETQRLLNLSDIQEQNPVVSTVNKYAQEIKGQIKSTLAQYAEVAQAMDQSFPQRLLKASTAMLNRDELKQHMLAIEYKRAALQRIGLLDQDQTLPFDVTSLDQLEATQLGVMELYANDTAKKLSVFDELSARLNLLLSNLNRKFNNKQLAIDKHEGLVAIDSNGKELSLDWLSSGEQHELVLVYDLLFRVCPDTLVMIDEPELSLHISWQKSFLSDLLEIVRTAHFDVILATHSPFIAGEYNELMVPLLNKPANEKQ